MAIGVHSALRGYPAFGGVSWNENKLMQPGREPLMSQKNRQGSLISLDLGYI